MSAFDYQKIGSKWLAGRNEALLADEMGLGKTLQVIHATDLLYIKRVLVICPAVARINWAREFDKWSLFTPKTEVLKKFTDPLSKNSEVVICSYEYVVENHENLRLVPWDCVVIDEVHFLKSIDAKRSKIIFGREGIIRKSKRVWGLSGTPAPNNASELWILLYTFGVTTLNYSQFVDFFCDTIFSPHGKKVVGTKIKNIPELKILLSKIMLRRKKADVLKQLPSILFSDMVVEPGFVDLEINQSFFQYVFPEDKRSELFSKLKKETEVLAGMVEIEASNGDRIKMLEGMAQSVSTLRRYSGLQKVEPVADLIKMELDLKLYEKIVIFAIHRDVIEGLRSRLTEYGAVTLYGGTEPETRQKNIDKFMKNKTTRVFIGNIAAAGTNITLTSAHNVTFIEQDWVPGNNAQAAMRVHRIGQTQNVSVRFISLNNPMDEKLTRILRKKTKELTEIFDS